MSRYDPALLDRLGSNGAGFYSIDGRTCYSDHEPCAMQASNWVQLFLSTPVVLWAGWPFLLRGWNSVISRHLNMFTLIAMGTGVAFVFSVLTTISPKMFPTAVRNGDGSVATYFEAAD